MLFTHFQSVYLHCSGELGEGYSNRVESFGLDRAYMKFQTPNSCFTKLITLNLLTIFMDFCDLSEQFWWVYQSHYCASEGAFRFFVIIFIVIMCCPSSVRPSSLTFHIFDFFSETAKRNSTKLDRKQDLNVLYKVCVFRTDRKNKMAALAFDWLRHFRLLLWNRLTEFNETWQEARSQCPLQSLCFSDRSEKQDGRPGLWLAETFSTSPLKPLNGIQRNLTGSKISMSSTKFVFFGPIGKVRWPPWPLIGWDIFDFSFETAERNWMKLDRKQDLNVLYQVCVFRADRKNKMATLASDWLRHFDFSETAERNLTKLDRKQDLNVLYQDCVFRADRKTRWPTWPLIGWDIFNFFSETAERNSTKLDRKQDLNVLYQVCDSRQIGKTRWPSWPIHKKGGTLYSGARYVALWASCSVVKLNSTNKNMLFSS